MHSCNVLLVDIDMWSHTCAMASALLAAIGRIETMTKVHNADKRTYRPKCVRRALRTRKPLVRIAKTTRWIQVSQATIIDLSKTWSMVFHDGSCGRVYGEIIPPKV